MESTSCGHAGFPSWLNNLGHSYYLRCRHTGNLQDIEHAISYCQKALESTPLDHANCPDIFSYLGNSYCLHFEHTQNLQDIEHAISCHQRAVDSTPSGHAKLPPLLNNLGCSYLAHFKHTQNVQDIEHAISYHWSAVESTPSGYAHHSHWLMNLGNCYLCHFQHTKNLQDIEHAISYYQRVVESTPSGHGALPGYLHNLGNAYLNYYKHTRDLQHIEHAISNHQKAVNSTPSGHADLPSSLNDLGNSYLIHFKHTSNHQDVDHAIFHHQRALKFTPSGHPTLANYFRCLGWSYEARFQSTHSLSDIQASIALYRESAQVNGKPSICLKSAARAAILSSVYDSSHCLDDFALAISLLSQVAGLEQTIHCRHTNISLYSGLVQSAVATALQYDRPDLALEWLEQGCCLVWNQLNQLHTPTVSLYHRSSSLANHFVNVARALEDYGTHSSIISFDSTMTERIHVQDKTRDHTILVAEYKQLLEEIQGLPDFHDFLKPPNATDLLSSVPSNGPVIIFNLCETQCDALALISEIEEPLHIPLENFSVVEAMELYSKLQSNLLKQREVEEGDRAGHPHAFPDLSFMPFILKELWDKVVHPVLEALGYSVSFVDH